MVGSLAVRDTWQVRTFCGAHPADVHLTVLPYHRHVPSLAHLTDEEKLSLADVLSRVTKRYDNLFYCPFAYSMGIHQRPLPPREEDLQNTDDEDNIAHLHLHFFPPLLRSASVRKFLVGFELMGESQRDFTPELAAQRLRECSDVHYLDLDVDYRKISGCKSGRVSVIDPEIRTSPRPSLK
ncbi:HIT-like domain-containing protein [Lactarius hatsudake]|nr:HIT-like domain-containing protein [Lactarius hatsudake]